MEDGQENLYDELDEGFNLGEEYIKVKELNGKLLAHVDKLQSNVKRLCEEILRMKKVEDQLKVNISELFNTAKNELERKDRRLTDVQSQLDDLILRRNRNGRFNTTENMPNYRPKQEENQSDAQPIKNELISGEIREDHRDFSKKAAVREREGGYREKNQEGISNKQPINERVGAGFHEEQNGFSENPARRGKNTNYPHRHQKHNTHRQTTNERISRNNNFPQTRNNGEKIPQDNMSKRSVGEERSKSSNTRDYDNRDYKRFKR